MIDVVIDTETTGLDPTDCQLVSIGWAFRNPEENTYEQSIASEISSGNILVRPDIERLNLQSKHQLEESLHITGMKMEDIVEHPIPYYTAIDEFTMQLRKALRTAGFSSDDFGGYYVRNVRFLAYNRQFDFGFIRALPNSDSMTGMMPDLLYDDEMCELYAPHKPLYDPLGCLCASKCACIMERASERWGAWSDYHNSYRWLKLTHAYSKLPRERQYGSPLDAHNSEADSIMALLIHEYLEVKE